MICVGVDVDNVLRNISEKAQVVFEREYPDAVMGKYKWAWDFPNINLPLHKKLDVMWKEFPQEIFGDADPYSTAQEDLCMLQTHLFAYHKKSKTICVTHQVESTTEITKKWLKTHNFKFGEIIITAEKHKVNKIDFLIDDSPGNYRKWVEEGRDPNRFIMMNESFNQSLIVPHRINRLREAIPIIDKYYESGELIVKT